MPPPDLPVLDLDGSADLYLARTAPRPHRPFAVLPVAIAVALALLAALHVTVTVGAPGVLRPAVERHEVLAPANGVVAAVAAREGQAVRAGALLVSLAPGALEARARAVDAALVAARARAADLEALLAAGPRTAALRTGELRDAAARAVRERADRRLDAERAADALARLRRLAAHRLAVPAELEDAARHAAQADTALEEVRARQRAEWQAELARARELTRSTEADRASLLQERDRLRIRAPIAGAVEVLTPLSPGSFVAAGERIAVVSPAGAMVVEAYVAARDVGLLRVGGPVRLLVDAFDQTRWGALDGRIASVADDFTLLDGRPVYRVRCVLPAQRLVRPDGARARLRKGMTVRARFPVGRRTLLSLAYRRLDGWVEGAGRDFSPPAPSVPTAGS